MSAWILTAALLCLRAPASASAVEIGDIVMPTHQPGSAAGAAGSRSPIMIVPDATSMAPTLNTRLGVQASVSDAVPSPSVGLPPSAAAGPATSQAPSALGIGASSSPKGNRADGTPDGPAPQRSVPPTGGADQASLRAAAGDHHHHSDGDAAGQPASENLNGTSLDRLAKGAFAFGRRLFDRAENLGSLAETSAETTSGAPVSSAAGFVSSRGTPLAGGGVVSEGEVLHDAVAAPVPAAATMRASAFVSPQTFGGRALLGAPGGAPAARPAPNGDFSDMTATPKSFARLSLELGSGLAVKVLAALGLQRPEAAAPRPFAATANGGRVSAASDSSPSASAARAPSRVPLTSTEWLERRGLLESLSASEAAASQIVSSAARPASSRTTVVPALTLDSRSPARIPPLVWWALALLPAGFVLIKKVL